MVEEQTGTEQTGDAGQKTGNNDTSAGVQQGVTQGAAGNQNEIAGLKAATVAEREKRQAVESENQNLRDQMAIMSQPAPQRQEKTSMSQAVATQLGIDIEIATPEEICRINEGVLQITSGQQNEQSFVNSHPDFAKVVGVMLPGGKFQPAPPLTRQLNANPALSSALDNSPNKSVLAYAIASKDPKYLAELTEAAKSDDTKAAEKAEASIDAANKQLSVSAVKGSGNLDKVAAIRAMNDEEFRVHNQKIMDQAL